MDDTLLREQLRQSEERNEARSREVASLRVTLNQVLDEFAAFRATMKPWSMPRGSSLPSGMRCGSGWRSWKPPTTV